MQEEKKKMKSMYRGMLIYESSEYRIVNSVTKSIIRLNEERSIKTGATDIAQLLKF